MKKHGGTLRDAIIAASVAFMAPQHSMHAAEASDWLVEAVADRMRAAPWWVAISKPVAPEEPLGWRFRDTTSFVGFACTEGSREVFVNFEPERPKLPKTRASLAEGPLADVVKLFGLGRLIEVRTRWDDTSIDMMLVRTPGEPYLEFFDDEEAARLLKGARTLLVEFPWDSGELSYFRYSLTGSRAAIERAERECNAQRQAAQARELEQERKAIFAKALEEYVDAIQSSVARNWRRPTGVPPELKCTVNVVQATNGKVLRVEITESSGNVAFDRSVEQAVLAASPLPPPRHKAVFDREIIFRFNPGKETRMAKADAVEERGAPQPARNATEAAIAALPADDQIWIRSSCRRELGPAFWSRCVEREAQTLRATR